MHFAKSFAHRQFPSALLCRRYAVPFVVFPSVLTWSAYVPSCIRLQTDGGPSCPRLCVERRLSRRLEQCNVLVPIHRRPVWRQEARPIASRSRSRFARQGREHPRLRPRLPSCRQAARSLAEEEASQDDRRMADAQELDSRKASCDASRSAVCTLPHAEYFTVTRSWKVGIVSPCRARA